MNDTIIKSAIAAVKEKQAKLESESAKISAAEQNIAQAKSKVIMEGLRLEGELRALNALLPKPEVAAASSAAVPGPVVPVEGEPKRTA